jgi:perosamine synthetase
VIPVNEPLLGESELQRVAECVRTGWVSSSGSFIEEFEQKWAAYCGVKYGVAMSNGTVALQAAVACLDPSPGAEVITPAFTIVSCALAAVYSRCTPVLVDSDPNTWCMDPARIEERITKRTKAIMPVHIYGHPVDMDPVLEVATRHGLTVIEDAAEAHGATYKGRRCGGLGHLSCFSFYANKIVTTGEGGMVLTNYERLAERLRSLRNLGFRSDRRFYHTDLGHNFRLTNVQAAIGVAQLERVEQSLAHKRWVGQAYTERLKDLLELQLPVEREWATNVYWMYGVVLRESAGMDAAEFAKRLAERGVMTRPFFLGMHEQPVFRQMGLFQGESYPVAERLARQGLYLPSGMTLTQEQLDRVCEAVKDALGSKR